MGCGATVVVTVIALGIHSLSHHVLASPAERALQLAQNDFDRDPCLLTLGGAETTSPAACLVNGNQPRVLLWGNSIADRFYPALLEWTSQGGDVVGAENLTKQGCPPLAEVMPTQPLIGLWKPYRGCRAFDDWVLRTRASARWQKRPLRRADRREMVDARD